MSRIFSQKKKMVKDDDEMNTLIESIQTQGVLSPLIVRPIEDTDEYEVISGHRRLHAAQKAGITEVPALIYALDRDAAAIAVVDSNLNREHILPSEKAFAYKLKMEALSHQSKRTDLTSTQSVAKLRTGDIVGETLNERNANQEKITALYCRLSQDDGLDGESNSIQNHLCLEGKGPEQIARLLQKEQVFTPTAYYHSIGSSSANRPMPSDPYLWKDSTIDAILSNRKYTGCMVNLKTTTVSYKVHKLIRKPEEEWSIVSNAQEAIIDENTWLRVQELRKNKRRPTATGKTSLFSGLVFCADCGSKLHFCAAKSLKADQEFFRCANYKSGRGECTIHYIRNVVLEQIVSVAVSDLADFVTCHESFFLQMIGKQQSAGKDQNIRSIKSDITAEKHRVDEIDRLIAKLYEDNFAGKLSDERYSRMAAKYEKEQAELLQSVSTKEKELAQLERESVDIRLLLAGLREYSSMETLTPEVVNKIIKRIEVHNSEMVNGHKRVRIDIHFTGVGLVDLATIKEMLAIAESSRP